MTDFRIDQTSSHTRVWLHGVEITDSIREVLVKIEAGRLMRVELDLNIIACEITALAEENETILVHISDEATSTLELLGWIKSDRTTYTVPRVEGDYS